MNGSPLPSGTVTFLFTDVEGSTRLLQEHGPAYADLLAEHRRVIRGACARHHGVEVDTQGDAFFVAFMGAAEAVAAAVEAQTTLEAGPTRVRIGVHTGEPLVTGEVSQAGGGNARRAVTLACIRSKSLWESLGVSISVAFWTRFVDRYLAPARASLKDELGAARAEGRALAFDDAVSRVRDDA